jgi:type VI secretion system protein ImpH
MPGRTIEPMSPKPLDRVLLEEPYRFEFFQAVRLFERVFRDKKEVGGDALPAQECVRFRSRIAMDFPPSEIQEIRERKDEENSYEMLVNFMGMVGVSGVLPTHYTELVLDRVRHQDTAIWSFLDIFTHRAVSMFFRAWEKYRFPIAYERGNDDFTSYLFDIAGLGTTGLRGRMNLDDESLLPYTALIAQKPHSQNAVANVISDYFSVPAKIEQFFGQWLALNKQDLTKVGVENSRLGVSAIAGSRIWHQQTKFRIKLGPLKFNLFQAFLPTGSAYQKLRSIVKFMVSLEFDFDVQLKLKAAEVPGTILTTRAVRKPMLGWTSFLKSQPFKSDDEQLVLAL